MIRMLRDPHWPPAAMAFFWLAGFTSCVGLVGANIAIVAAVWSLIMGGCP